MFKQLIWVGMILASISTITIPVNLQKTSLDIAGYPQNIYTVTLDMDDTRLKLSQGFSFDTFYGFETTSEIAIRHDATIAVNGMFYNSFGMPYGIITQDGKMLSISSTGGPVVYMDNERQVHMAEMQIDGFISNELTSIQLWGVNVSAPTYAFVLYDAIYGRTTRVYRPSVNYIIKDNVIIDIIKSDVAVSTENSDYVLTHITSDTKLYYNIGDTITIDFRYDISTSYNITEDVETETTPVSPEIDEDIIVDAFQTGGWLVYDGENVAKDYEPYVGYTTSLQPRTLVGITGNNELVFMVIDGRYSGISAGVTGNQGAELMMEAGCLYAGYLDGGASSTLVIEGQVMNRPSMEGDERIIAHCVMISFN
jgi:exopolysaccharide biosynthesis protein